METNCKVDVYVSAIYANNVVIGMYFILCHPPMDRLSFIWFLVRMTIFATALIIAARPDLDNPGCYRNGLDYFRLALEVITLICFIMKGYDEIREMIT